MGGARKAFTSPPPNTLQMWTSSRLLPSDTMLRNSFRHAMERKVSIKVASVGFILCFMVVYLSFESFIGTKPNFLQINLRKQKNSTIPANQSATYTYSWPKCERDNSVTNISGFNSLPGHLKDFLYYKHCRHFPMLLDFPDKCGGPEGSADVFLLLVIKSLPGNYDRREVLRNTWAKERLQNGVWIRRLFISGTMDSGYEKKKLNRLLEMEQRKYNDILQWDFYDSFFNLTLKQILFLEWMERNCPHVRFMLNGDDDVFANTDNMILYLKSLWNNNGSNHLFTGDVIYNPRPIRNPKSKYYIPVQVHESNSYPAYCGGGGFLLSGYTASIIYKMSHSIPFLPIDDVYMAMCLEKAGVRPKHHLGIRTAGLHIPDRKADQYDPCFYRDMLLVHRFLSVNMYVMWQSLHEPHINCSHSTKM
ncbi:N-acetyllactosaminide beta-1,3-N-acetylglucosaminyltransferase 3 [Oryzias latipes]|uniref:Hexosyltransferase n=1 Tax=Oryzias latipes TaxID=8090 RepID=H2M0M8_ORYLA|nr:N-acetyllactosaminide beta-1,3-N-acetylglucosaminyltransferase 3 [Oryzias latipes]